MWLVQNNSGHVIVTDDGGNEVFSGNVRVALLGFGRAMHRMDEAATIAKELLARVNAMLSNTDDEWKKANCRPIAKSLEQLAGMLSCGAGPSYTHNAES